MLKGVEKSNPGILSDGDRVWNMDDTSISCEIRKKNQRIWLFHKLIMVGSLHYLWIQSELALKKLESPSSDRFVSRELGLFEEIQEYK